MPAWISAKRAFARAGYDTNMANCCIDHRYVQKNTANQLVGGVVLVSGNNNSGP
jgi:hypothetical protein